MGSVSTPLPDSGSDCKPGLHVAIIGGGITGITLALGLQHRNISCTIYERASALKEIGAGIGFSPNAERALVALNPRIHAAYKKVATPNGEDYFQWVDGKETDEVVYRLYLGEQGFQGCRRSDFLEEMVKMIPSDRVKFEKEIDSIVEDEEDSDAEGKVTMRFKDGTAAHADIVIGCDGIRSRVRQILLGPSNPASFPSYTHEFCFRALVPMDKARAALGEHRTSTRFMYNGPNAHAITYPVSFGAVLNILLVIRDPESWMPSGDGRHTSCGSKEEALRAFQDWHPTVQAIVDLLPEEMDKWAIFDMLAHPAPSYCRGRICIAGDAAHAVGPHLGAGAGFGMEDALAFSCLLHAVDARLASAGTSQAKKAELCTAALETYNDIRYERTQWLAPRTIEACDLFQWRDPEVGSNYAKFGKEITWRFHKIWEYDVDDMVKKALEQLTTRVGRSMET